jgi:hypothetical protein
VERDALGARLALDDRSVAVDGDPGSPGIEWPQGFITGPQPVRGTPIARATAASWSAGTRRSRWRCGPALLPVLPEKPITSPRATWTPRSTSVRDRWM